MLMTMTSLMTIITVMVMLSPFSESVMTIGMLMMISALVSTIILTNMVNTWFALILFLIYITGLLVLFSYMMALSPNNLKPNKMSMATVMMISMTTVVSPFICKITSIPNNKTTFEMEVIYLLNYLNIPLYWSITIVLLLALIMVVTLCYKSPSPLRPFL